MTCPHDRVSLAGDEAAKARLIGELSEADPVAAYRALAANVGVTPDSPLLFDADGFGFGMVRQGGYVYFAAWVI